MILFKLFLLLLTFSSFLSASQAYSITDKFVAPCCWRDNLTNHQSPEAEKLRIEIQKLILQGKSEEEVLELYIQKFGQRILREPQGDYFNWLLIIPITFLLLGTSLVTLYIYVQLKYSRENHISAQFPLPITELSLFNE